MTPRNRQRLATVFVVGGALLIGVRVVDLVGGGQAQAAADDGLALPLRPQRPALPPQAASSALRLERLQARLDDDAPGTLFAPLASAVPAPAAKPLAPQPEAPPPPPPFPYAYLGGMTEDGRRTAYFASGDRVLALRAGDPVDANFRVDALDETQMTVTYLPLDKSLVLPLGVRR